MHSQKVFTFCWYMQMLFHLLVSGANAQDYSEPEPTLNSVEESAVYDVLGAINPEIDWKSSYPDNVCTTTGGPHGIVCEKGHIVELNLGWVSDYSSNPPCAANASFPSSIVRFSRLRKLFFYKCFTNEAQSIAFPSYLWSLGSHLQELVFLENPSLQGVLGSGVGKLVGLKRFIVSGSSIGGEIPLEIGQLKGLEQLVLSGNKLNASIPASLSGLRNLVILDLSRNNLEGPLPGEIGKLKRLSKIDLSFNVLSGNVPCSWSGLGSLTMMDLGYNYLSGGIPLFISGLPALKDFHLSGNPMGGPIPDFWDKLSGLETLGLSEAGLVGGIPQSMCALKNLTYMALDNNNLSDAIPRCFDTFSNIYNMDLSGNQLKGFVPFSSEFVGKMGRKLELEGNSELCYGSTSTSIWTLHAGKLKLNSCVQNETEASKQDRFLPMLNSGSMPAGAQILFLSLVLSLSVVTTL